MKLIPISEHPDAPRILYQLLEERQPEASISHKKMPTWEEHLAFIKSRPYWSWYLLETGAQAREIVGAAYLTRHEEIGVSIFRRFHRVGFGYRAVFAIMAAHGRRRYIANVAPANEPSRKMFEKLGFKLVQHTYSLEAE